MSPDMDKQDSKQRGRPAGVSAVSHDRILDAVQSLLEEKSAKDLTIEEVSRRADVGKPTIYKWWPTKMSLVLDLFRKRIMPPMETPDGGEVEEEVQAHVLELIRQLNGFFGKVSRDIIAAGQSDPGVLEQYREICVRESHSLTSSLIERAKADGKIRQDVDTDLLVDMIYGPIYYRLMVAHQPLDAEFGHNVVHHALSTVTVGPTVEAEGPLQT